MRPLDEGRDAAASGRVVDYHEITLSREDEAGMVFISCKALPSVFIAVRGEDAVRDAIGTCLSNSFKSDYFSADVFTNDSIKGPDILTIVKLTK